MAERTCSVEGCERPWHCQGYCAMHWARVKKFGEPGQTDPLPSLGRPRPPKIDWDHGSAQGYNYHRCRCDLCKAWRRNYQREYSARRLVSGNFTHGKTGYILGCRCEICGTANSERYARAYEADSTKAIANAMRQAEKRRARQRNLPAFKITDRDWRRLCNRYDNRCAYCGEAKKLHRDHVVPITRGGQHSIGNLIPACKSCNLSKMDKFLMEWRLGRKRPRKRSS